MNHAYAVLLATALLVPATALAQQPWQPFRPGLTYQFSESGTPGDTTHTLQLGAGTRLLGTTDSVFCFNGRAGRITGNSSAATCNGWLRMWPDNLFGATLHTQPNGVFVLAAVNGRTLTLRPRTATGQSWATGLIGLSAQVTSRAVAAVLAGPTDSLATILFSDGQTLRLSKYYGLLEGPSLDSYLNGRNRRRALTLTALPQRRLGTARVGARAAYDFQPGDLLQRYTEYSNMTSGFLCSESWEQDSVLTRTLSRTGDSIIYTILIKQRSQGYGSPGNPFCGGTSGITISPPRVNTLVVADALAHGGALPFTGLYATNIGLPAAGRPTTRFGNSRFAWSQSGLWSCQQSPADSVVLYTVPDGGRTTNYTTGLGKTDDSTVGYFMRLTYYRKGPQTWGTPFARGFFLPARATRPAATTAAFPNPFAHTLTATFALARPQAVAAELRDGLGRAVRLVPGAAFAAGAGRLELPTAGLPAGVYTLHLTLLGEGRTEVLKVVRGE